MLPPKARDVTCTIGTYSTSSAILHTAAVNIPKLSGSNLSLAPQLCALGSTVTTVPTRHLCHQMSILFSPTRTAMSSLDGLRLLHSRRGKLG